MKGFRNPITNKRIEVTDEEDELIRQTQIEQGIFYYEAWKIIKEKNMNSLLSY